MTYGKCFATSSLSYTPSSRVLAFRSVTLSSCNPRTSVLLPHSFLGVPKALQGGPFAQRRSGKTKGTMYFHRNEPVHDWRVKEMIESAEAYFTDVWTKGKLDLVPDILHDSFVHRDAVWSSDLVVGETAFKAFVAATRKAYPDFWIEICEIGTSNPHQLFISWEGAATWLGDLDGKAPSHHNTKMSGISLLSFDKTDHKRMTEVCVYRTAFAGDKQDTQPPSDNWHELRLAKLQPDS